MEVVDLLSALAAPGACEDWTLMWPVRLLDCDYGWKIYLFEVPQE